MLPQSQIPVPAYTPTPLNPVAPGPLSRGKSYDPKPKQNKPNALPFDEWIIKRCKKLLKENEIEERQRIRLWVTLWKRFRGDSFGYFAQKGGVDRWVDVVSVNLKKRNLFAPVVRSNTTNWLSAHVKLQATPSNEDDPQMEGASRVLQAVLDYVDSSDWTEDLEERAAEFAQLSSAYFIRSGFSRAAGDVKVQKPVLGQRQVKLPGVFQCPQCQTAGPAPPEMEEQFEAQGAAQCPQCGGPAYVKPGVDLGSFTDVVDYEEMPGGSNTTRFVPAWEIKIDERHAQGGGVEGLKRARWILHRFLAPRYEIEQTFGVEVGRGGEGWSEALKWQRALETTAGTKNARPLSGREGEEEDELLEVHVWYFSPAAVSSYISPSPYQHTTCGWALQMGQTPTDVNPSGTCVVICNEKILKVYERNKDEVWTAGQFQMDATAYWGRGLEDLEDFQKMYNTYLNSRFKQMATGAAPPIIIDGMLLDQKDVEFRPGRTVTTRRGFNRNGQPISNFYSQLMPQPFDTGADLFAAALLDGAQDTMGVQPATVGAPDPTDKTFQGQLLKRQASVALMIPSQKSKRQCKTAWGTQQARIAQQMWMPEHYAAFLGDEFAEEDIRAFKDAVIGRDLMIAAADGTDIPRTYDERKMDGMQFVQSGVMQDPTLPVELKSKLARYHGVDLDVDNYERDRRLASFRYQMMKQMSAGFSQMPNAVFLNPMTQQIEPHPAIEFQILNNPLVAIFPETDQHQIHIDFLTDRLDGLAARANQDILLIALTRKQIQRHKQGIMQAAMEQAALEMQAQGMMMGGGVPGAPGGQGQVGQGAQGGAPTKQVGSGQTPGAQKQIGGRSGQSQPQQRPSAQAGGAFGARGAQTTP